jgi:serine/threonine protein kinase
VGVFRSAVLLAHTATFLFTPSRVYLWRWRRRPALGGVGGGAARAGSRREVLILNRLKGCEHVIYLKDVFEDSKNLFLVTELCAGGELYDQIEERSQTKEGRFSEVSCGGGCGGVYVFVAPYPPAGLFATCNTQEATTRCIMKIP